MFSFDGRGRSLVLGAAVLGLMAAAPAAAGPVEALFTFEAQRDGVQPLTVRVVFDEADALVTRGEDGSSWLMFEDMAAEGEDLAKTRAFSFTTAGKSSADVDAAAADPFRAIFFDIFAPGDIFATPAAELQVMTSFAYYLDTESGCAFGLTPSFVGYNPGPDDECVVATYEPGSALLAIRRLDEPGPGEVPEPAMLALFGAGAASLGLARRRRPAGA